MANTEKYNETQRITKLVNLIMLDFEKNTSPEDLALTDEERQKGAEIIKELYPLAIKFAEKDLSETDKTIMDALDRMARLQVGLSEIAIVAAVRTLGKNKVIEILPDEIKTSEAIALFRKYGSSKIADLLSRPPNNGPKFGPSF